MRILQVYAGLLSVLPFLFAFCFSGSLPPYTPCPALPCPAPPRPAPPRPALPVPHCLALPCQLVNPCLCCRHTHLGVVPVAN